MTAYAPERGDIVWLSFDPQAGREQVGHRLALVLSPRAYNAKAGLMLCCPMTTKIKGYPFEVAIAGPTGSAALADQVKSLDWRAQGEEERRGVRGGNSGGAGEGAGAVGRRQRRHPRKMTEAVRILRYIVNEFPGRQLPAT